MRLSIIYPFLFLLGSVLARRHHDNNGGNLRDRIQGKQGPRPQKQPTFDRDFQGPQHPQVGNIPRPAPQSRPPPPPQPQPHQASVSNIESTGRGPVVPPTPAAQAADQGTKAIIQNDRFLSNLANNQFKALDGILHAQSRGRSCPPVWFDISRELTRLFKSGNECNTAARTAIRTALHDCITLRPGEIGGCDGSLFLAGEHTRAENQGVDKSAIKLANMASAFNVGVADMFQFAAAHAVVTCPLGPRVRTFIGRVDSNRPAPPGRIPKVFDSTDTLIRIFGDNGLAPFELSALIGAHTCSRQFFLSPSNRGAGQDSTPGIWDVAFYGETLNRTAPFIFDSDTRLSQDPRTGPSFAAFVENQSGWNAVFSEAMGKISLLGVRGGEDGLVECTEALPAEVTRLGSSGGNDRQSINNGSEERRRRKKKGTQ